MHIMDLRKITNAEFDANTMRASKISRDVRDDCQICGKAVNSETCKTWVHISTEGILLDPNKSTEEYGYNVSQGFFPVGSECAKSIPAQYKYVKAAQK